MKTAIGILFGSALLCAQEPGMDRVTVPLSDPSRPHTVKAHLMSGGITVRGYGGKDVIVEARTRGASERSRPPRNAEGMKRIDNTSTDLNIEEENNVVSISTRSMNRPVDLILQVPANTSLQLKCMNDGDIAVENVNGELEVNNLNGAVTMHGVGGSVVAHSLNGRVAVTMTKVMPGKAMSFSSMNGDIDVTLPGDSKARVKMKTDNGEIYSDFEIRLEPSTKPAVEDSRGKGGHFRLRIEKAMYGTINGGGPEFQFQTLNGNIFIRKTK